MQQLVGKLAALDPDAGAALKVIAYFDNLLEMRAGLESMVRGAALLSGLPAFLVAADRGIQIRVDPDGLRTPVALIEPTWSQIRIGPTTRIGVEHPEPAGAVCALVLERAAVAIRAVLDRAPRTPAVGRPDAALVEIVLDCDALEADRLHAARRLDVGRDDVLQVVASLSGRLALACPGDRIVGEIDLSPAAREQVGIGPPAGTLDLPATVGWARAAALFTAAGDDRDPGPRVVSAVDLGGLILLAKTPAAERDSVPDVHAIEAASSAAPWMLATLDAVAAGGSLRAIAARMTVHHSTLQERVAMAERLLGWPIKDGGGRVRLQVALMVRRLNRNAARP
ncbi:helix-turn-helix domain-containing protein [Pseudonocardia sp. RS010]|uniref:PucR family transcriptional regulator n=1 Tax=Pseudonocardia sp. RS010 TaxID=3385979 RepID=UPI0039A30E60